MDKIILVDGNNLLFRSYYATAYSGNFMKNSKNFPTNALFGFVNMMNKIISEENPTHIIVAFDKGKTFRHEKYDFYKDGRNETPSELKQQFPYAKEILKAMGIKSYEIDNYEADDILGTFAKFCDLEDDFIGTIISSDKDLLQLISSDIDIKLLKQKDYIRYDNNSFVAEYGFEPIKIIDLKALMGDSSDNIPGVKGIGEKTALKLLQDYGSLDGVYNNIDNIKGKLQEKLINDKDNAYMSYEIATIYKDVPMEIDISDTIYKGVQPELQALYEELEFNSFLKNIKKNSVLVDVEVITDVNDFKLLEESAYFLEIDNTNYHTSNILGMSIFNSKQSLFIPVDILFKIDDFGLLKYTYDFKKNYVSLKKVNKKLSCDFDLMVAAYLLEYNIKDDIGYLINSFESIEFSEEVFGKNFKEDVSLDKLAKYSIKKAKFIYEYKDEFISKIKENDMESLFYNMEMPLSVVLADMEYTGVKIDSATLVNMGEEIKEKLVILSNEIYGLADCEFNISSPQQLGNILFEKLGLPHFKKTKSGYSTDAAVLNKLKGKHLIIDLILEYRMLSKLHSTYIEGLLNCVSNERIHTIYTQTLTRTGRLSSIEPNLQNIPIRMEYGRLIRKAFIPDENSVIISADYSQIELRILAHMANIETLIEAFNNGEDIHTKTASEVFKTDEVTKEQRRVAKAVNFGIIYGISSFGLGENLGVSAAVAKDFIEKYFESYPGVKLFMDETIDKAKESGFSTTMFNRKRTIDELNNTNHMIRQSGERIALNTPIQGTAADIIKLAMVSLYDKLNEYNLKSKILIQVHDELVLNVCNDEIEFVKKLLEETMENVIELSVPLKIEIETGLNWYEAK